MPRQVIHAANMRYIGQPTISLTVDGNSKITNLELPSHSVMRTRRLALPPGIIGHIPQVSSAFQDSLAIEFESAVESEYSEQQLFHFFEVQFRGTVELAIYADEVQMQINNTSDSTITLTPRDNKQQDTRRVYFPPQTYGWIPHIKQIVDASQDGEILNSRLRSLPARFSRGEKEHSEIQVTHQGGVTIDVILDGQVVDTYRFDADPYDSSAFVTEKEYLPSGTRGHILQWIQTSGEGEVALFESDVTLTDRDQPQQEL